MTIGFDGSRAFVENRTGTENYSFQLLKALVKIDIENLYLIYIRKGQNAKVKTQSWPSNFKFKVINFQYLWTQIGLALMTFVDPLDVLFVPAHTLPLIRRPGLKTVLTVHDLGAEYLPGLHQLKQVLYLKLMTYYQLKSASKIIAVSEATKKDLIKKAGVEGRKIEVVYEGVDKEAFSSQPSAVSQSKINDILRRYDIERDRYFLFVGTIQPRKNLERLIKAFSYIGNRKSESKTDNRYPINDIKLVLVGQKGWKSDSIYNLPKDLRIQDQVVFSGRVSEPDLVALYKGAIALTFPSVFEGFGLPILEAFASGCPVITSNTSSMPEVAGDAAILVNPQSETEITEAMEKIIKDDKLRDSLILKGYSRIKDFSWEKAARETLNVFKDI